MEQLFGTCALSDFLSKRSKECTDTGCKIWKLKLTPVGYGTASWRGKSYNAHVLAYLDYHKGNLPRVNEEGKRLVIRHICHNKACIAEKHLVLGTCTENANDMILAGNDPHGERSHLSKITEEIAVKIIESYYPPSHPNHKTRVQRAKELNVGYYTVKGIDLNHTWTHLPRKIEYIPVDKKKRKISCLWSNVVDEDTAKVVLASKKHKYDPSYLTQRERAKLHGLKYSTTRNIDSGFVMGHLPRPTITTFPKPQRSLDDLKKGFEKVKSKCKYTAENNKHVGTPCLEWQGVLGKNGRPTTSFDGILQSAYIFSCEYHECRFLPKGMHVRHLCNNTKCCEPTHLKMGTALENANDKLIHATQSNFKLNFEMARQIRLKYKTEELSHRDLGRMFKISSNRIGKIIRNEAWIEVVEQQS